MYEESQPRQRGEPVRLKYLAQGHFRDGWFHGAGSLAIVHAHLESAAAGAINHQRLTELFALPLLHDPTRPVLVRAPLQDREAVRCGAVAMNVAKSQSWVDASPCRVTPVMWASVCTPQQFRRQSSPSCRQSALDWCQQSHWWENRMHSILFHHIPRGAE